MQHLNQKPVDVEEPDAPQLEDDNICKTCDGTGEYHRQLCKTCGGMGYLS